MPMRFALRLVAAALMLACAVPAMAVQQVTHDSAGRPITFDVQAQGADVAGYSAVLDGLLHGAEISDVTVTIVPQSSIASECEPGAVACYRWSSRDGAAMFVPSQPPRAGPRLAGPRVRPSRRHHPPAPAGREGAGRHRGLVAGPRHGGPPRPGAGGVGLLARLGPLHRGDLRGGLPAHQHPRGDVSDPMVGRPPGGGLGRDPGRPRRRHRPSRTGPRASPPGDGPGPRIRTGDDGSGRTHGDPFERTARSRQALPGPLLRDLPAPSGREREGHNGGPCARGAPLQRKARRGGGGPPRTAGHGSRGRVAPGACRVTLRAVGASSSYRVTVVTTRLHLTS